jgi:phosphoribosylformylglycinamidine (FGAM) synthase-like enzyme
VRLFACSHGGLFFALSNACFQGMSKFAIEFSKENLPKIQQLYEENGFVLIDGVFTEQEADEMKREMSKIVDNLNLEASPKSVFSTQEEDKVCIHFILIQESFSMPRISTFSTVWQTSRISTRRAQWIATGS